MPDGTPLTECDENGRIVPAEMALNRLKKDCSGGALRLADRWTGIPALARAPDKGDSVQAPILLLQLQIDQAPNVTKYNTFHKPPGTGGGQFTSVPSSGGLIQPVEWSLKVDLNSTYQRGVFGPDMDAAHDKVFEAVRNAILEVGSLNFRPGMDGYGILLHKAIALEILAINDPDIKANPMYLEKNLLDSGAIPAGASIPDATYAPGGVPRIIFEFKSGSATDTSSPRNVEQRGRALQNAPGSPLYEYIQVYEK